MSVLRSEFKEIASKFTTECFSLSETKAIPERGGVYIFFNDNEVWKIGKSNTNALRRALEHIRDDTGSQEGKGMAKFKDSSEMKLLLISINDPNDTHWVLALENYLERHFSSKGNLVIKSRRNG